MYEKYQHWSNTPKVWVDSELRGKHREHCLCWNCSKFNPDDRDLSCKRANHLYSFCVLLDMTTPVYECPVFDERR